MSGKINYPLLILSVMIISVVILSTALLNSNLFETNGNSGLSNNNSPAGSDFSRIYIDTLNPEYTVGDEFVVSGNTTLGKGDEIRILLFRNTFISGLKDSAKKNSIEMIPKILSDESGNNRWSAVINTTGFWQGEYIIIASSKNDWKINSSRNIVLREFSGSEDEYHDAFDPGVFIRRYGNFSQENYSTRDMLAVINRSNSELSEYMGSNGPLVGYGLSHKEHIEVWWNKDTEVNESTMDQIYSVWNKNGKLVGIEDIPVVFTRSSIVKGDGFIFWEMNNPPRSRFVRIFR
jgi:hypothetical protein